MSIAKKNYGDMGRREKYVEQWREVKCTLSASLRPLSFSRLLSSNSALLRLGSNHEQKLVTVECNHIDRRHQTWFASNSREYTCKVYRTFLAVPHSLTDVAGNPCYFRICVCKGCLML